MAPMSSETEMTYESKCLNELLLPTDFLAKISLIFSNWSRKVSSEHLQLMGISYLVHGLVVTDEESVRDVELLRVSRREHTG